MASDGFAMPPTTAIEAAELLDHVANARDEYVHNRSPDRDLLLSIDMIRACAHIIRTGEVWPWVPTWTNGRFK